MHPSLLHPTALRPWQPLTDEQFAALKPYLPPEGGRGKPADKRKILNAIFWIAASREPWKNLPSHMGNGESVARTLRRWARAGYLDRLLVAVSDKHPLASEDPVLKKLAWLICRAFRRMARIVDEASIRLAETLGLRAAWPALVIRWPDIGMARTIHSIFLDAGRAADASLRRGERDRPFLRKTVRIYGLCQKLQRWAAGNRREWRLC